LIDYKDYKYKKKNNNLVGEIIRRVIISNENRKQSAIRQQKRNKLHKINVKEVTERLCKIIGI